MTSNDPNNSEKIRKAYDETADFYDNRYEKIQYIKYSLLLPKIWTVRKNAENYLIHFDSPFLDFGGGGGLLLKFLSEFMGYLKLRNTLQNSNNSNFLQNQFNPEIILLFEWILHQSCFDLSETFEKSLSNIIEFDFPDIAICDISPKMLIRGRQQMKNSGYSNIFKVQQKYYGGIACTGESLPMRDNIFPLITSFTVLQNIPKKELALEEIERISCGKRKVAISILKKAGEKMEFVSLLGEHLHNLKSILPDDDDTMREFRILKNKIESYFEVFIENSELDDIRNIEDYLFYSK